jgi:hypothetical protein
MRGPVGNCVNRWTSPSPSRSAIRWTWAGNVAAHVELLLAHRTRVMVFPELSLTGYDLADPSPAPWTMPGCCRSRPPAAVRGRWR